GAELMLEGYNDASFQSDDNDAMSMVAWKSSKHATIMDFTTKAEYIAASKAAKEAV
ncbi:UNVERIFIED_CONTAM: hypothetical protein Sradi_3158000, partial [Sesamum radiatum]